MLSAREDCCAIKTGTDMTGEQMNIFKEKGLNTQHMDPK